MIQGKTKFKKKSAWRKYATFMGISTEIVSEDITRDEQGRVVTAKYEVKATAKNGRSETGIGVCSIWDKSHEHTKTFGNRNCQGPCDGRKHFDKPEHDIPSTAHTRAKNRAISDLIGAGEVSAEEVDNARNGSANTVRKGPRPGKRPQSEDTVPNGIDKNNIQDAEVTPKKDQKTGNQRELIADEIKHLAKEDKNIKQAISVLKEDNVEISKLSILKTLDNMLGDKKLPDFDIEAFKKCKEVLRIK
jgi:hypothetical protein